MFISVVVPIYKVEKYIKGCIESVLSQSFEDFELILVDDGSPDGCPDICDGYAKKDSRIKVIHKQNGGLVSARKAGFKATSGEYVLNLDGDDELAPGALRTLYNIAHSTGADIICFSYIYRTNGGCSSIREDIVPEKLYDREQTEKELFPKLLLDENMHHLFYFLSGKAIKRNILEQPQLAVNDAVTMGEDICTVIPCFMRAQSVYMSKKALYMYNIRSDSMTTSFETNQIKKLCRVIDELKNMKEPLPDDFPEQISRYALFMCFAIIADAAERKYFGSCAQIKRLVMQSQLKDEIKKAKFRLVTKKSRISVFLIKNGLFRTAFAFLYLCRIIKNISGRKE